MTSPTFSPEGFATRFKRWLLTERVDHLGSSDELGDEEERTPHGGRVGARALTQEPEAVARGVIQREQVPLLARYGTSYGLFDAWIADYQCVLISDVYELGAYVGDSVWVSGSLTGVIGEIPVMEVTHLELLNPKWMR